MNIVFAGEDLPAEVWARRSGIPVAELLARLGGGWTVAEALAIPACGVRPADRLKKLDRPCPRLALHKGTRQACASYKIAGRRYWHWFGPWRSRIASVRYNQFRQDWPRPLVEGPPIAVATPPRILVVGGVQTTLTRAARAAGLKPGTVRYRLDVLGWDVERALSIPAGPTKPSTIRAAG